MNNRRGSETRLGQEMKNEQKEYQRLMDAVHLARVPLASDALLKEHPDKLEYFYDLVIEMEENSRRRASEVMLVNWARRQGTAL